jgi:hypothetical protein
LVALVEQDGSGEQHKSDEQEAPSDTPEAGPVKEDLFPSALFDSVPAGGFFSVTVVGGIAYREFVGLVIFFMHGTSQCGNRSGSY